MSTLTNVKYDRSEDVSQSVRFTPAIIPEAKSSKTGVPVRYVPTSDKQWYVVRASYGREDFASDHIVEDGSFTHIAKHKVRKMVNDKQRKVIKSLIPNLLFVYTTADKAEEYTKDTPAMPYLSYYYNHFETNNNHKNPPLTILCREMENFIFATCNGSEHLMFVSKAQYHFKGGETVLVTDGLCKGVEGKVARVSGQQHVIVSVTNVGLISTTHIPTAFIQII